MQNPRAELVNRYLEDPPTLLMPVHMGTYTAHVAMTVVITVAVPGPPRSTGRCWSPSGSWSSTCCSSA